MASKRRAHGEGCITQRKDGRWEAKVFVSDLNGQKRRKSLYGATQREVMQKLQALEHNQRLGLPVSAEKQTVSQYLTDWLLNSAKPSVRPKTFSSYSQLCELYIIPSLGRIQLHKLTAQDIQRFLTQLSQRRVLRTGNPIATRTIHYAYSVLRSALNQAVNFNLIPQNPVLRVKAPGKGKPNPKFLTPEQTRLFLTSVKGSRLECLYTLAITLGLRQGELLGLTWDCIDLETGKITVNKAAQRVDGKLTFIEPKSESSKRTLALSKAAEASLRGHRVRQLEERLALGAMWQDHNLVFPNTLGGIYDAGNMVREFHKALERAGLPRTNFHSLRHTCGSLLLAQKTDLKVVQDVLGHSDFYTTANIYLHVIEQLQRDAADRMDAILNNEPDVASGG